MKTSRSSNVMTDPMQTDLNPGDHLCWLYETEEEYRVSLGYFFRRGIERGEKVLYMVNGGPESALFEALKGRGSGMSRPITDGQVYTLPVGSTYLRKGTFDPDAMIDVLRRESHRALDEGYSALRVIGEMGWVLQGANGSERFVEYEYLLDAFLPGSHCSAICPYDQRRFGPMLLLYVMAAHPKALIGSEIYENPYYMPPPNCLGNQGISAATLHHWLEDLAARKQVGIPNHECKDLVQVS